MIYLLKVSLLYTIRHNLIHTHTHISQGNIKSGNNYIISNSKMQLCLIKKKSINNTSIRCILNFLMSDIVQLKIKNKKCMTREVNRVTRSLVWSRVAPSCIGLYKVMWIFGPSGGLVHVGAWFSVQQVNPAYPN